MRLVLKRDLTDLQIKQVLYHPEFPRRSFLEIARDLKMADFKSFSPYNDLSLLRRLIKKQKPQLEQIIAFRKADDPVRALQLLTAETKRLIQMSAHTDPEAPSAELVAQTNLAINSWMNFKAQRFIWAINSMPTSLI